MTDGGKYHPPLLFLLFSFCSQYKSKKISPGVTFWILCTKMQVCTRFGSWRPPCIFQNLFIIIVLMQMIISQTKDFAQTNGYLSNKRRAQSRRGDIAAATVARSNTSLKRRDEGRYKPSERATNGRPYKGGTWFVLKRTVISETNNLPQSRRGDHWSPAQTHRSSVGMKVDINPRKRATNGRPYKGGSSSARLYVVLMIAVIL